MSKIWPRLWKTKFIIRKFTRNLIYKVKLNIKNYLNNYTIMTWQKDRQKIVQPWLSLILWKKPLVLTLKEPRVGIFLFLTKIRTSLPTFLHMYQIKKKLRQYWFVLDCSIEILSIDELPQGCNFYPLLFYLISFSIRQYRYS